MKRTSLVIPTASDLPDSLNTNVSFVNDVLVFPWLSIHLKKQDNLLCLIRNLFILLILKYIFSNYIYFWYLFHLFLDSSIFTLTHMTIGYFLHHCLQCFQYEFLNSHKPFSRTYNLSLQSVSVNWWTTLWISTGCWPSTAIASSAPIAL